MDLIGSPELPDLSPPFYINGMKIPAKRGYVQDPIAQYRRRTNGLSDTNLPSHPGRATYANRALSAATRIVTKQCGPLVPRPRGGGICRRLHRSASTHDTMINLFQICHAQSQLPCRGNVP